MKIIAAAILSLLAQGPPPLVVTVDGKPVAFRTAPPQTVKGRVMVPLRGVFEAIGAYVEYDPANRLITARRNNEDVQLRVGDPIARKNGAEILMDVKPSVVRGTTLVPLRFLTEALGAKVNFDKPNNRVDISTPD